MIRTTVLTGVISTAWISLSLMTEPTYSLVKWLFLHVNIRYPVIFFVKWVKDDFHVSPFRRYSHLVLILCTVLYCLFRCRETPPWPRSENGLHSGDGGSEKWKCHTDFFPLNTLDSTWQNQEESEPTPQETFMSNHHRLCVRSVVTRKRRHQSQALFVSQERRTFGLSIGLVGECVFGGWPASGQWWSRKWEVHFEPRRWEGPMWWPFESTRLRFWGTLRKIAPWSICSKIYKENRSRWRAIIWQGVMGYNISDYQGTLPWPEWRLSVELNRYCICYSHHAFNWLWWIIYIDCLTVGSVDRTRNHWVLRVRISFQSVMWPLLHWQDCTPSEGCR
jgi:hypothetical protein